MDMEKAKDLLAQGGWTELFVALCCALCHTNSFSGRFAIRLHLETQQPRSRFLRLIHVCFVTFPSRRCYFEKIDEK